MRPVVLLLAVAALAAADASLGGEPLRDASPGPSSRGSSPGAITQGVPLGEIRARAGRGEITAAELRSWIARSTGDVATELRGLLDDIERRAFVDSLAAMARAQRASEARPAPAVNLRPDYLEVYLLGVSHHMDVPEGRSFNETNPGLGIGYSRHYHDLVAADMRAWCYGGWSALALAYEDSYSRLATGAAIGGQAGLGSRESWFLEGSLYGGFLRGSGWEGPVVLPILGVGYRWVAIQGAYIPSINSRENDPDSRVSAVGAWLRISIPLR
jgi:hypothetical protein